MREQADQEDRMSGEELSRSPGAGFPSGNPDFPLSRKKVPSLAERVLALPWLAPSATSLVTLARSSQTPLWPLLRDDPGVVLLLLRQPTSSVLPDHLPFASLARSFSEEPDVLERAIHLLAHTPSGVADFSQPGARQVYDFCLTSGILAQELARRVADCDPEKAWVCGMLAPLGWLGVCALQSEAISLVLGDPEWQSNPAEVQRRHWGAEQSVLARGLARRWQLPGWVGASISALGLPLDVAQELGADPILHALMRVSAYLAQRHSSNLALVNPRLVRTDVLTLGLSPGWLDRESAEIADRLTRASPASAEPSLRWQDPHGVPLLVDLLKQAVENRRLRQVAVRRSLEMQVDQLLTLLERRTQSEQERLHREQLEALAEFAAGAGHEINNPLAVISGQAQYLLTRVEQGAREDALPEPSLTRDGAIQALEAIISQSRRIHSLLRELMQFARPVPPQPQQIDLPTLLWEVASSLAELADQKHVRIEVKGLPDRLPLIADPDQMRTILSCLFRNAVEAAPQDGWARFRLLGKQPDNGPTRRIRLAVEDNGTGPDPEKLTTLFYPFYSGRSAGRGRGLGLPISWRLARLQGGEVRLEQVSDEPITRFVLEMPLPAELGDPASTLANGQHTNPSA